jgi:hypothetical protein
MPNIQVGLEVYLVIMFGSQAVYSIFSLLANHNDRRLKSIHEGKNEAENNKRIRVKRFQE